MRGLQNSDQICPGFINAYLRRVIFGFYLPVNAKKILKNTAGNLVLTTGLKT